MHMRPTVLTSRGDLQHFIRRSAALTLYRQALRLARAAPPGAREGIVAEARAHFTAGVKTAKDDPSQEAFLLSQATKELDILKKLFTLTR
jgi:Complex 1 protein (LYR family)